MSDSNSPRGAADVRPDSAGGASLDALHASLATLPRFRELSRDAMTPLRTKGLVHAHVRLGDSGAVLRIPRLSSFGYSPAENLDYQATCFRRAGPSGHVPALIGKLDPADDMPWGALVVEEIAGRAPRVPAEMPAIACALAAIHALPLPSPDARSPLQSHGDPVAGTLAVIETQAGFLEEAGVGEEARRILAEELEWAREYAAATAGTEMPVTLVGTDTHPGNFMIREGGTDTGTAVFVDLEKTLYGAPAIDLAHASVYTSTMWDPEIATALKSSEVADFYAAYFEALPADLGDRIRPLCAPMRRFTWLRTTTWAAKWRVDSRDGAAWSAASHDSGFIAQARARVADYLDAATIARIRDELASDFTGP